MTRVADNVEYMDGAAFPVNIYIHFAKDPCGYIRNYNRQLCLALCIVVSEKTMK